MKLKTCKVCGFYHHHGGDYCNYQLGPRPGNKFKHKDKRDVYWGAKDITQLEEDLQKMSKELGIDYTPDIPFPVDPRSQMYDLGYEDGQIGADYRHPEDEDYMMGYADGEGDLGEGATETELRAEFLKPLSPPGSGFYA